MCSSCDSDNDLWWEMTKLIDRYDDLDKEHYFLVRWSHDICNISGPLWLNTIRHEHYDPRSGYKVAEMWQMNGEGDWIKLDKDSIIYLLGGKPQDVI